jgi:hypothetical protein
MPAMGGPTHHSNASNDRAGSAPTAADSSDSEPLGPSAPVGSEPKDVESAAWRNSVTAAGERNVVRALEALRVGDLRRARQSLLDALRALEEVR